MTDFITENIIPGNFTKILFIFGKQKYIILALYGPRKDDVDFVETVFSDYLTQDSDMISYVGDWNIVLNQLLENNTKNRNYVKDQVIEKEQVDVW